MALKPSSRLSSALARADHLLVGDFVLGRSARRYASLVFLLLATAIGLGTYVREGWVIDTEVSLRPDLLSGVAAFAMVLALYLRRTIELAPSIYSLLSLLLNVTITAIFVEAMLGGGVWSLAGLSMPYLVGFAIVLTWVGLRPLAPLAWLLVVVVGFVNLQAVSDAMGLWGYLFILFAALGVLLQLDTGFRQMGVELRHDFLGERPSLKAPGETGRPMLREVR